MSGSFGGGQSRNRQRADSQQQSYSHTGPWAGVQPYLMQLYQQAGQAAAGGYPVAGLTAEQEAALSGITGRAGAGSAQEQALGDYITQTLGGGARPELEATARGENIGGNPYLDQAYQRATQGLTQQFSDVALPGVAAQFGGAGRTGGGIHQQAVQGAQQELAQGLGGVATDIYGSNYQLERTRQLEAERQLADDRARAAGFVPGYTDLQYGNLERLLGVGEYRQGQTQSEALAPFQSAQFFADILRGLTPQEAQARSSGTSSSRGRSDAYNFDTSASFGGKGGSG